MPAGQITGMKFSTEAIVAAVIAAVFGTLTLGAIAREQGERATASQAYVVTTNARLSRAAAHEQNVVGFY